MKYTDWLASSAATKVAARLAAHVCFVSDGHSMQQRKTACCLLLPDVFALTPEAVLLC